MREVKFKVISIYTLNHSKSKENKNPFTLIYDDGSSITERNVMSCTP
jgi:hypothetical protein